MKIEIAVNRLAALAQESRLGVFRLLVRKGRDGLPAGEIARRLRIPPAALSFHLKEMVHAGLLRDRKEGRYVHYAADFKAMNDLVAYLGENCCVEGEPDAACAPGKDCKSGCK